MTGAFWPALVMSLQIAMAAVLLCALVAVPLAYGLSRVRLPGQSVLEAVLTVPLVLPPTVVGYMIIAAAGARTPLGAWLRETFNYSLLFTMEGAVLAAAVVALPLLYMPAKAAFLSVDRELEDASRQMGAGPLQVFWHVSLPLARRGIVSGLLLAFARALGEFGATVMVFGTGPGPRPLPIQIYLAYESGQMQEAVGAVVALTITSLVIIFAYNRSSLGKQE